jgi:hypothetical protein
MASRKKTPPRRAPSSDRTGALKAASVPELHAELQRRSRVLGELKRKRGRLVRELARVDRQIAEYGPAGEPLRRKRPKNPVILVDALKRVLNNRTLSVTKAAEAVQRAGYKTTSENFRTIVNQTLIGNKKAFKKVSRGMYTLQK